MSVHEFTGGLADLRRELEQERRDRDRAIKLACDALGEQLETEVAELHRRIDEVHERALRQLTSAIEGRKAP